MNKFTIAALLLCLFGIAKLHAQTTSTSSSLVAQPIPDRTVTYSVSAAGVAKPVTFGLDLAWLSEANIRRGIAFMGKPQVRIIRSSFTPTDSLINGELKPNEMNVLNQRLNIINTWIGPTTIALNDDNPSVSSWYKNADGTFNAARWAQLMDVTTKHHQEQGHTVITVGPFNEPDYNTGQGSMQDFYNIAGELKNNLRFSNIRIGGGNTLNDDNALTWYNYLKARLDEGNTHQLAGSFDNFASFYQTVRANGHHATGDELHNVMEAMVGAQYGMQTGIWWGTAELARGEFVKASDGVRLGYAEHRPNWTAASVYKAPDGKVQAFGGTSERQGATTTYSFISKDKDVYYNGYGPMREYSMVLPGGAVGSYQNGQTNAERVVNITWGEDIQPAINGKYVLVNRSTGMVMEVPGGSTTAGTFLQQNTYSGATYQQWNVTPVDSRIGGDFSYFTLTNVNSAKAVDDYNWSLDNGSKIDAWDDTKAGAQQWYLEYTGDGWFYIRCRQSAKCVEVSSDGVNIDQWDVNGSANQQWRLLPVDAAIEFSAPGAPANLVATAQTESVKLTWTANAESDLAGYNIYRSETAGGPYNTIARGVPGPSFVDNIATAGGTYFYKVKAVDKSQNRSAYSGEVSATPTGSKDLVAFLPFDINAKDTSVNLNHSAVYGSTTFSPGVSNNSLSLNGSSAFVQLPSTIANHQEITIASWIKWNGGSSWQRIFDFGNDQSQYMFLTPSSGSGTLRFAIKNGGGEQILEAPALPANVWSHVAVTLGASGATLYVNGQQVAQSAAVTIRPQEFKPVLNYIGRSQYPDPLLNGSIDEFKIFNYSLSAAEVLALVNQSGLQAISNPKVASGDAKVILRWDAFLNTKYEVLRSETAEGTYTVVATNLSTPRYEDAAVTNGKTYYYKVVAYNAEGRSPETLLTGKPVLGQHVYLPFNESTGSLAEDVWGAKDATLATAATFGDGYNSAHSLKLDGTANGYATLPSGVVSTLNDFTISAWVNPNQIDWWMRLFDFGTGTNNYMMLTFQSGFSSDNGVWKTQIRYEVVKNGSASQVNVDPFYHIEWNQWTHFAVTQSGNTVKIYINGELKATATVPYKPSDLGITTQNYIGKSQYPDRTLQASVDAFKIYNRALSAAELAEAMKAEQVITFNAIPQKQMGDADFDAGATTSSGLPVTYSSSNEAVATIVNGKVHITGAGMATITAQQSGNAQYLAAEPKSQTLTVNKKEQTITFDALLAKKVGDADFDPAAIASSSLPLSYSSSNVNVATITNDSKIHIVGGGTAVITASQGGNDAYKAAQSVTRELHVVVPPLVKAKNVEVAVDENGNAVITPSSVDDGSVSYNGTLRLEVDKTTFTCSNIATPVEVTLTGTDDRGYTSSATAIVTIIDNLKPSATAPASVTVNADKDKCTASNVSLGNPIASDNCGVKVISNDAPAAFPVGNTTVTWTVEDVHGNVSTATQTVTVTDAQKPTLIAPSTQAFCYTGSSYQIPELNASDNCGISTTTFAVTGATARSGAGNNASGIFNVGLSTITWTVTDVHGNTSTASIQVDINAPLSAAIPDVYALNPAVDKKNTLYLGYGPSSLTVTASPQGGTAPYTYKWSSGQLTQAISVSAAGAYSVTVKDAKGCTTNASIVITVVDVRCGNKDDKVMICHNGNTICVSTDAVQAHLDHGDRLGECNQVTTSTQLSDKQQNATFKSDGSPVVFYPNPVTDKLTIQLTTLMEKASLQLYNATGAVVLSTTLTSRSNTISLKSLPGGVYYAHLRNGQQTITEKIVKQ